MDRHQRPARIGRELGPKVLLSVWRRTIFRPGTISSLWRAGVPPGPLAILLSVWFAWWGGGPAAAQAPPGAASTVWPGSPGDLLATRGQRAPCCGFDGCGIKERLFSHSDPDDPLRHRGIGSPLAGTSWRNRPLYAGWLVGALFKEDLTNGVDEQEGLLGGYRVGYDFDHYWGVEGRFAFANLDVLDHQAPAQPRTAWNRFWDADLLYYPWGDARWRPFFSWGLGAASFHFTDAEGRRIESTVLQMPFGVGLKCYYQKWLALRLSLADNFSMGGGGLNAMHSISLTAGVEVRFGGRRTSYYPWDPSVHLW